MTLQNRNKKVTDIFNLDCVYLLLMKDLCRSHFVFEFRSVHVHFLKTYERHFGTHTLLTGKTKSHTSTRLQLISRKTSTLRSPVNNEGYSTHSIHVERKEKS